MRWINDGKEINMQYVREDINVALNKISWGPERTCLHSS